jgi:hypothetical protein
MALVNSLVLDVGALQSRIEAVLGRLQTGDDRDSQMRMRAVLTFKEAVVQAATRLRQEGIHLAEQGTLW